MKHDRESAKGKQNPGGIDFNGACFDSKVTQRSISNYHVHRRGYVLPNSTSTPRNADFNYPRAVFIHFQPDPGCKKKVSSLGCTILLLVSCSLGTRTYLIEYPGH